jgi:hypothetical protein
LRTTLLAFFAAALIVVSGQSKAAPRNIDECEKIQAADAYNLCLASFGPVARGHHAFADGHILNCSILMLLPSVTCMNLNYASMRSILHCVYHSGTSLKDKGHHLRWYPWLTSYSHGFILASSRQLVMTSRIILLLLVAVAKIPLLGSQLSACAEAKFCIVDRRA